MSPQLATDQSTPSTSKLQPYACVRCWQRKKKCDRVSPVCGLCVSTWNHCVYSSQPPTRRPDHLQALVRKPTSLRDSYATRVFSQPDYAAVEPPDEAPRLPTQPWPEIGDLLNAQIHRKLEFIQPELDEIFKAYLASLNSFLPIVIDTQIPEHLIHHKKTPTADICSLILSIYLVVYRPSEPNTGDVSDSLYSMIKMFHSRLLPSIESIQAGILISLYEHGQALGEASYLTIGACSRMGYAMGMHKTMHQESPNDPLARSIFEKHRHVWWCVVIAERFLNVDTIKSDHPLGCRHPLATDYLPSFYGRDVGLNHSVATVSEAGSEYPLLHFERVNAYARTAQATYLLSLVLTHISSGEREATAQQAQVAYLHDLLQKMVFSTIGQDNEETDVPWDHSCGAFILNVTALWRLHEHNLSLFGSGTSSNPPETSILALQSLTRSIIDKCKLDLDGYSGPGHATSSTLYVLRAAIHYHFETGSGNGRDEKWLEDMQAMLHYLGIIGRKWKVDSESLPYLLGRCGENATDVVRAGDLFDSLQEKLAAEGTSPLGIAPYTKPALLSKGCFAPLRSFNPV